MRKRQLLYDATNHVRELKLTLEKYEVEQSDFSILMLVFGFQVITNSEKDQNMSFFFVYKTCFKLNNNFISTRLIFSYP